MDCSENMESIDGVIRQIRELFNDSGGRNMPRVLAAFTSFWPTVRRALVAEGGVAAQRARRPLCAAKTGIHIAAWSQRMLPVSKYDPTNKFLVAR